MWGGLVKGRNPPRERPNGKANGRKLSAGAISFQAESCTPHWAKANGGLRRANPPCGLPQFENICTLRTLAQKVANQGSVSHFWRPQIKQRLQEDPRHVRGLALLGGICWSRAARRTKRVHLALLRAHSGCDPEGGARAVPGRGFANCVRAVRKLARPAKGRSARSWLPGERIGCPLP
jgi:hypothetical protein